MRCTSASHVTNHLHLPLYLHPGVALKRGSIRTVSKITIRYVLFVTKQASATCCWSAGQPVQPGQLVSGIRVQKYGSYTVNYGSSKHKPTNLHNTCATSASLLRNSFSVVRVLRHLFNYGFSIVDNDYLSQTQVVLHHMMASRYIATEFLAALGI